MLESLIYIEIQPESKSGRTFRRPLYDWVWGPFGIFNNFFGPRDMCCFFFTIKSIKFAVPCSLPVPIHHSYPTYPWRRSRVTRRTATTRAPSSTRRAATTRASSSARSATRSWVSPSPGRRRSGETSVLRTRIHVSQKNKHFISIFSLWCCTFSFVCFEIVFYRESVIAV